MAMAWSSFLSGLEDDARPRTLTGRPSRYPPPCSQGNRIVATALPLSACRQGVYAVLRSAIERSEFVRFVAQIPDEGRLRESEPREVPHPDPLPQAGRGGSVGAPHAIALPAGGAAGECVREKLIAPSGKADSFCPRKNASSIAERLSRRRRFRLTPG